MVNMRPLGEVEYDSEEEEFDPQEEEFDPPEGVVLEGSFNGFVYFNIEMKCCFILNLASSFAERGPQTAQAKRAVQTEDRVLNQR
jgi:hypothetical protein